MGLSKVETLNSHNQHHHIDESYVQESLSNAVDEAMEFLKNESKVDGNNQLEDEQMYDEHDDFLPPQHHEDNYDPEADHFHDGDNDPNEVFKDLNRILKESYEHYSALAADRGEKLPLKDLSITDVDLRRPCNRREITMYELVDAWKSLIDRMIEKTVFMEYVPHLETAFYQTASSSSSVKLVSEDPEKRNKILTLVILLERSVDQYALDKSITCRFVTLLEIILSYCPGWKPSEEVTRFWMRLMQRIPPDIPPLNFRRRAYRVLVSLSWVPSSNGLLDACSFEHMKQATDYDKAEPTIKAHMERIRGGPLPRYDCVNQLLDRLKDETDVCVAITSKQEGSGKTTLAAQVASHPSIQRVFTVLWLKVESNEAMTYERYKKYLNELCSQLPFFKKQRQKVSWPKHIPRFEEPALRKLREKEYIEKARERMSEILQKLEKNVLLVLDDIHDASFIEWFRFHDRQSVIVTTLDPDLETVDWAVELAPMSDEEATELFLKEASLPVDHVLGSTKEVQHIIKKAECNPLLVRTLARWYQLKQVTAGTISAIQEVVAELKKLEEGELHSDDDSLEPNQLLFDVLSLMMAPTRIDGNCMSTLFVLCFAAMVVVFDEVCPLDSVLLLWDQVLKIEPMALDELTANTDEGRRRQGWFIAEGLSHMGLITVIEVNDNPWVHVHHQLYRQFAILMATQMDLKENFDDSVADWNLAFVTAYFHKRIQCDKKDFDDNSWDYAIEKLPAHMFKGKMLPTAATVLSEQTFFQARIEAMGWDLAVEQHIRDCVCLQQELEKDSLGADTIPLAEVFHHIAAMFQEAANELPEIFTDAEVIVKECRALYHVGVALTENGYYNDAIEFFENAQGLAPQSRSLRASILYSAGWALLAKNEPDKAKKKINASRKIMDQGTDVHVLYKEMLQVYADALVATCDYKEAASFYEVMVENLSKDADSNPVELGTALYKKGKLNYMMGDLEIAKNTLNECIRWKTGIGETSRSISSAYGVLGDILMELKNVSEARKCQEAGLRALDQLNCDSQQLDHKLMSAKVQFLRNDFDGAFKSFSIIRRTIKESPLMVLDQSAYDLRIISRFYLARGDFHSAISMLRESLQLTVDRPNSLERAWTLIELGNCLADEAELKDGLTCYEQALEIQIAMLGESTQVFDTSKLIGNLHLSLGEYDESLSVFSKSYEILQRVAPDNIDRIAGVLYLIGEAYDGKQSYRDASEIYENCLKVLMKGRSHVHADIGKVRQRIGEVAAKLNEVDKAYENFSEALVIRKMNFDERQLAETMHSLGVIHRKRAELNAAKKSLLDSLEIRKKLHLNRESAETLVELANVYRIQHELGTSAKLLEKSLELTDDNDVYRGSIYLAYGHVKFSQEDFAGSIDCYKSALLIRVKNYGRDHLLSANVSKSLGLVSFLSTNTQTAIEHLSEFVRVCDLRGGDYMKTIDYAMAKMLVGDLHKLDGKIEEALHTWTHVKEIYDDTESINSRLPAFGTMLHHRLGDTGEKLVLLSEEKAALLSILFIDD